MRGINCPKAESILEWVSIPQELSWLSRMSIFGHVLLCKTCKEETLHIKDSWRTYLEPEPEITQSIMRVYSRLKHDETLILKGWKLGETRHSNVSQWLFPGIVATGALALALWALFPPLASRVLPAADKFSRLNPGPLAQIRYEDKNHVQVHYVQPELIKSIEFETTSGP